MDFLWFGLQLQPQDKRRSKAFSEAYRAKSSAGGSEVTPQNNASVFGCKLEGLWGEERLHVTSSTHKHCLPKGEPFGDISSLAGSNSD